MLANGFMRKGIRIPSIATNLMKMRIIQSKRESMLGCI